jgi:hypothetical protein
MRCTDYIVIVVPHVLIHTAIYYNTVMILYIDTCESDALDEPQPLTPDEFLAEVNKTGPNAKVYYYTLTVNTMRINSVFVLRQFRTR